MIVGNICALNPTNEKQIPDWKFKFGPIAINAAMLYRRNKGGFNNTSIYNRPTF